MGSQEQRRIRMWNSREHSSKMQVPNISSMRVMNITDTVGRHGVCGGMRLRRIRCLFVRCIAQGATEAMGSLIHDVGVEKREVLRMQCVG